MMTQIKNKNLFLAEKIFNKIDSADNADREITIFPKNIPELTEEEIRTSLRTLKRRGAINFSEEDQNFESYPRDISPNKNGLKKFIETTNDEFLGMKFNQKKFIQTALITLQILTDAEEKIVNLENFEKIGLNIIDWIEDYSYIVRIREKLEADVDYSDGVVQFEGASYQPQAIDILDQARIEQLREKVFSQVAKNYLEKIRLLLNGVEKIDWRCVTCCRFFESLFDPSRITVLLNQFIVNHFMSCNRCRTKNYFTISQKGKIKFLSSEGTFEDLIRDKHPRSLTF